MAHTGQHNLLPATYNLYCCSASLGPGSGPGPESLSGTKSRAEPCHTTAATGVGKGQGRVFCCAGPAKHREMEQILTQSSRSHTRLHSSLTWCPTPDRTMPGWVPQDASPLPHLSPCTQPCAAASSLQVISCVHPKWPQDAEQPVWAVSRIKPHPDPGVAQGKTHHALPQHWGLSQRGHATVTTCSHTRGLDRPGCNGELLEWMNS